jgi:hypothetical protein
MLAISYLMMMIGAIVSTAMATKIGIKKTTILGAFMTSSFVFC